MTFLIAVKFIYSLSVANKVLAKNIYLAAFLS